jgi:hypothetical protein
MMATLRTHSFIITTAYDSASKLLYAADTQNHLIRVVDLTTNIVSTLAGDITTGAGYYGNGGPCSNQILKVVVIPLLFLQVMEVIIMLVILMPLT